jgi:hypothetical protein
MQTLTQQLKRMFSRRSFNKSKWLTKYSLIKRKDRSMMGIEDAHTMKINIMKLTINRISLKETATKVRTLTGISINKNSQVMNGTF